MQAVISALQKLLADTYALYLKTQNYHWHVKGPQFKSHHELFEQQYTELALAVDEIAERILTLGANAPASFSAFSALTTINEGKENLNADQMLHDLSESHQMIVQSMTSILKTASEHQDEGTVALLSERIALHEKSLWMLRASQR